MNALRNRGVIDAGAGATEGVSRISAMAAIPLVLDEMGFVASEVLAEAGVDARLFSNPNNLIRDELVASLLSRCVARTGREDFALRVGQLGRLDSLGLVGALASAAPDVGAALRAISRFLGLNDGASIVSLSEQGALAALHYAIYEDVESTCEIYQMVSAVAWNVLRELCGPEWVAHEVQLPCRRPRDVRPFRDYFRAPLRFDSKAMALVFPRHWLDQPLRSADPALYATLSAQAATFEAHASADLPSQVRRVVRNLLLESKGSIEDVARRFSMHRRTLDRHLDASGSSFRALADTVRFEVARQLLRDTQMSVSEIAASLHYGDASAFAHAFRRWSGNTPSQWRESTPGAPAARRVTSPTRAPEARRARPRRQSSTTPRPARAPSPSS